MKDLRKTIWIDAPPEVVFEYLTDSEKVARWSGKRAEIEAEPGGIYRLDMGTAGFFEGRFIKVEKGKFLSWRMNPPQGSEDASSVIEITLTPEARGTRVDVRQTGLGAPFDLMASRGWDHHLARLSVAVQGGNPGEDSFCKRHMDSLAR